MMFGVLARAVACLRSSVGSSFMELKLIVVITTQPLVCPITLTYHAGGLVEDIVMKKNNIS